MHHVIVSPFYRRIRLISMISDVVCTIVFYSCEYEKARCTHRDLHVKDFGPCAWLLYITNWPVSTRITEIVWLMNCCVLYFNKFDLLRNSSVVPLHDKIYRNPCYMCVEVGHALWDYSNLFFLRWHVWQGKPINS